MVWKKVILGDIWGCLGRNLLSLSSQVKETLDLRLKATSRTLAFAVRDRLYFVEYVGLKLSGSAGLSSSAANG